MNLIIDIPEEMYKNLQKRSTEIQAEGYSLENSVLNGTPLPKGHGRLIDAKEVYRKFYSRCLAEVAKEVLDETSTILEADKVENERINNEKDTSIFN